MNYKPLIYLLLVVIKSSALQAQLTAASIFSDHMVLQRHVKIPVWGFATANETIEVSFHKQKKKTKTDAFGKWNILLDKEKAGGPYILAIKGKTTIEIKDVLVGEVWLCSGQSNMEWSVGQSDNGKMEIENAHFPNIRQIKIPKAINSIENPTFKDTPWLVCSPQTVADFSGIGYFFAKELTQKLKIPVGIINTSWGGTNIETWISQEGFASSVAFKAMIAKMPKVNLDSLLNLKLEVAKIKIENLQQYKFNPAEIPKYKNTYFDDTAWLEINQPGVWEEQVLGSFDGVVWLRKQFVLTEINTPLSLEIPAIDDNDETFVNGIKVGQTEGWDNKRKYFIPSEILKTGKNVIAIRVTDNGGNGGIHGKEEDLKLLSPTTEIPLSGVWKFQVESIKNSVNQNEFPSLCYNAMIHPLVPFALQGVLWYQGESNVSRAFQYREAFPALIKDWRSKFKSNFPFYFVQLASFKTEGNSNEGCEWAELREAQTNTLQIKNTGMVVTTDLVTDAADLHPKNKQAVALRLAGVAFDKTYNTSKKCTVTGPTFKSWKIKEGYAVITFENWGSGLCTFHSENAVIGFEIAGENQIFYPANAQIRKNTVIIKCEAVPKPFAIRYAWMGDASACNLANKEGFPVVPFRTDDWELKTQKIQYTIDHKMQ